MTLESTRSLVARIRDGDELAAELLMGRHLPALRRWAHGRMPGGARHLADTDDLVQATLLKTLSKVMKFEVRRQGAFFAYLRRALDNQIRDHLRAARYRPGLELAAEPPAREPSPLEEAIGGERLAAYEGALKQLQAKQREAVILRVELDAGYGEIAEVIGSPSANAARMVVSRALVNLAELMDVERGA